MTDNILVSLFYPTVSGKDVLALRRHVPKAKIAH